MEGSVCTLSSKCRLRFFSYYIRCITGWRLKELVSYNSLLLPRGESCQEWGGGGGWISGGHVIPPNSSASVKSTHPQPVDQAQKFICPKLSKLRNPHAFSLCTRSSCALCAPFDPIEIYGLGIFQHLIGFFIHVHMDRPLTALVFWLGAALGPSFVLLGIKVSALIWRFPPLFPPMLSQPCWQRELISSSPIVLCAGPIHKLKPMHWSYSLSKLI